MLFLPACLDENGRAVVVTSGTVTAYYEGQAYVGANPLVSSDAVEATDAFLRGFRYSVAGALRVADASAVNWNEGIGLTASGQVCYTSAAVDPEDVVYFAGMAVTEAGGVYMDGVGSAYTGPLDEVPGAVVAFDQFAPSAAWLAGTNNYALLVRQSDAETQQFQYATDGTVPNADIIAWRDAEGAALARLVTWSDGSGNGKDISRVDGNESILRWNPDAQGGIAGFTDCEGLVREWVPSSDSSMPNGAVTVIVVAKTGARVVTDFSGNDYVDFQFQAGSAAVTIDMVDDGGTNEAGGTFDLSGVSTTETKIIVAAWQFGSHIYRINGVAQTQTSDFDNGEALGSIAAKIRLVENEGNAIQAFYVYPTKLSAGNITSLETFFATRYSITLP